MGSERSVCDARTCKTQHENIKNSCKNHKESSENKQVTSEVEETNGNNEIGATEDIEVATVSESSNDIELEALEDDQENDSASSGNIGATEDI